MRKYLYGVVMNGQCDSGRTGGEGEDGGGGRGGS